MSEVITRPKCINTKDEGRGMTFMLFSAREIKKISQSKLKSMCKCRGKMDGRRNHDGFFMSLPVQEVDSYV